jgi:hypothetical protein
MDNFVAVGLSIVLGLLGVRLIFPAWARRTKLRAYDAWCVQQGVVGSAVLREQPRVGKDGAATIDVFVQFEYRSGGQLHFGGVRAATFPEGARAAAQQCADGFIPHANLIVYCDPDDDHHVLLHKPNIAWRRAFLLGCILIILAILLVFISQTGG